MRLVVACCLVSGCFYIDPINEGPTASINDPVQPIERGKPVTFTPTFNDPELKPGRFQWNVALCDAIRGSVGTGCDAPFTSPEGADLTFDVPRLRADHTTRSQVLDVSLDARDDRGALGPAERAFVILDSAPEVSVTLSRARSVGAPIDLTGRYDDADDDLAALVVGWTVTPPSAGADYTFTDLPAVSDDATHVTERKRLIASQPGAWHVALAVTDARGQTVTRDEPIAVTLDGPPCLAQWQPIVPPSGAALPVSEPTVFQVPLVEDDLDAYPPDVSDPVFGTTAFAWSIRGPSDATRRPVGSGNSFDFDPRGFTPGAIVELRVEVFDRHATPVACPDGDATCGAVDCLQRQTWRVEVR